MGEIAEMMLDGTLDHETGEWNGFHDGEEPGFPMTVAEAEAYQGASEKPPHALRGDWAVIGRWVGSGREQRKPARAALGWSKRKLGGIICAMEDGGLVMTGGPEFWLTARGLAALEATR